VLPNGLLACLDLALGGTPIAAARRAALVVGLFREDVWLLGALAGPSPSLGHIWPLSRGRFARLVARAERAVDPLAADVQWGRALHVLFDMACPPHARAIPHSTSDPFERYVDAHAAALARLPVPELAPAPPRELITSLVRAAQEAPPSIPEQARRLIPLAGAHGRALLTSPARRP
jgi:hypothetical protein